MNDFQAKFHTDEFKNQNKDIAWLCQTLQDSYQFCGIDAPGNTIEWLNEVLELPGFFDAISAERKSLALTDEIRELEGETAHSRKGSLDNLDEGERESIRKLNRLLIELLHPGETPKWRYQLMAMIRTRRGESFLQDYDNIAAFRQDMKEHRSDIEWGLLIRSDQGKVVSDYFAEEGDRDKIGLVETEPKSTSITPEGLNPRQAAMREAAVRHFKSNKSKAYISGQLKHVNSREQLGQAIKFLFDNNGNPPPLAPIEDIIMERKKTEAKIEWLEAICSELRNALSQLKEFEEGALELLGQDQQR